VSWVGLRASKLCDLDLRTTSDSLLRVVGCGQGRPGWTAHGRKSSRPAIGLLGTGKLKGAAEAIGPNRKFGLVGRNDAHVSGLRDPDPFSWFVGSLGTGKWRLSPPSSAQRVVVRDGNMEARNGCGVRDRQGANASGGIVREGDVQCRLRHTE
jgi:hypothetical protein